MPREAKDIVSEETKDDDIRLAVFVKRWYGIIFFAECSALIWIDDFVVLQDENKKTIGIIPKKDFKSAIKTK